MQIKSKSHPLTLSQEALELTSMFTGLLTAPSKPGFSYQIYNLRIFSQPEVSRFHSQVFLRKQSSQIHSSLARKRTSLEPKLPELLSPPLLFPKVFTELLRTMTEKSKIILPRKAQSRFQLLRQWPRQKIGSTIRLAF